MEFIKDVLANEAVQSLVMTGLGLLVGWILVALKVNADTRKSIQDIVTRVAQKGLNYAIGKSGAKALTNEHMSFARQTVLDVAQKELGPVQRHALRRMGEERAKGMIGEMFAERGYDAGEIPEAAKPEHQGAVAATPPIPLGDPATVPAGDVEAMVEKAVARVMATSEKPS